MSKLNLKKSLLLFTFFFPWMFSVFAQADFDFLGKAMYQNKFLADADVLVYDNGQLSGYTKTNKYGSFKLKLKTQKKYLLEFKSEEYPVQYVIISTFVKDKKQKNLNVKRVDFRFPLEQVVKANESSEEKHIASFSIDESGYFKEKAVSLKKEKVYLDKIIKEKEQEISKLDSVVENKSEEVKQIANELPKEDAELLDAKLKLALSKIDSMVMMGKKKSDLILQRADLHAEKILTSAVEDVTTSDVEKEKKEEVEAVVEKPTQTELKKVGVNEKDFYEREDVKKYHETIKKYETSGFKSEQDSIEYYQNLVNMNKALLDYAKMQLEIDRLNARTHEDSVRLREREKLIAEKELDLKKAEETIENQKLKIANQKLEIQKRNLMLILAISGLLFFVILFFVVYQNYRLKKKTNAQLEKQNEEIALKNKKIIDSITYAKTIQQAILPLKSTVDKYFESFVIFRPKDIVSGDFYWFTHFTDTNTSVFAVVDCTGHGVPGAFMSMIGNRLLVEVINESKITSPEEILEKLDAGLRNALMQDETLNNDGMDMCVCTIKQSDNKDTYKVKFAGAKRPLFYSHDDKVEYIKGTVRGIGGRARLRKKGVKPFILHELSLNKGDMIYLTTDGFLDLQSPERKKFGRRNFIEVLETINQKPLEEQHYQIGKILDIHKGDEIQIDDITIMGVKL